MLCLGCYLCVCVCVCVVGGSEYRGERVKYTIEFHMCHYNTLNIMHDSWARGVSRQDRGEE